MRIYAERPGRAALQVLADVAVLAWVLVVADLAQAARAVVLRLQEPAGRLTGAGSDISGAFGRAAATAGGLPFVGDDLARALGSGTSAGESLSSSGRELAATVGSVAAGTAAAVVLLGVVPILAVWLALRVRWVRAARTARAADPDLLALHALARRPARRLLAVTPDPAGGWRRGDPAVVADLAALELEALGLRGGRGGAGRSVSR